MISIIALLSTPFKSHVILYVLETNLKRLKAISLVNKKNGLLFDSTFCLHQGRFFAIENMFKLFVLLLRDNNKCTQAFYILITKYDL